MELRHLRTFLAVVEHGGFRRAAAHLHFSQPAVTAHIHELERSLGVILFERQPGQVRLTAAGARFAEPAQLLVDQCDAVVVAARHDQPDGDLRVGVYPGSAAELTRPLVVELRRCWPSVDIEVVSLPLTSWASVIDGLDALIMRDPIEEGEVRATRLFSERLMAAVPWRWPVREVQALSLPEFLELPLIRTDVTVPKALRDFWSLQRHRHGLDPELRGYGALSALDVAEDVACGFGVALGTRSLERTFTTPQVAFVELPAELTTTAWLTTRRQDRRPLIEELHRTVDLIVRRVGPLVLPELSAESASRSPAVDQGRGRSFP